MPEDKILDLEKTLTQIQYNFFGSIAPTRNTEFHGVEIFQAKGAFKKRKLAERIQIFDDIAEFVINGKLSIRMICIDVNRHNRFLQVADVLVYIAGRCQNLRNHAEKWHDQRILEIWEKIKANTDFKIKHWP